MLSVDVLVSEQFDIEFSMLLRSYVYSFKNFMGFFKWGLQSLDKALWLILMSYTGKTTKNNTERELLQVAT